MCLELLPPEVLDALDWIEAERECRQAWYVGGKFPNSGHHTEGAPLIRSWDVNRWE
jgi:hypothetical protein